MSTEDEAQPGSQDVTDSGILVVWVEEQEGLRSALHHIADLHAAIAENLCYWYHLILLAMVWE